MVTVSKKKDSKVKEEEIVDDVEVSDDAHSRFLWEDGDLQVIDEDGNEVDLVEWLEQQADKDEDEDEEAKKEKLLESLSDKVLQKLKARQVSSGS